MSFGAQIELMLVEKEEDPGSKKLNSVNELD